MVRQFQYVVWVLVFLAACATQAPLPPDARPGLAAHWVKSDGNYDWPPDSGFAAPPTHETLPPDTLLDRFGSPRGRFLSPEGASYDSRALPYACTLEIKQYHVYETVKPLSVSAGKAAPWFDEPGGAIQYMTDESVQQLLDEHALIEPQPQPAAPSCAN
ncbi:MAG TPA: TNT domain-containing protein [Magnetospirillaceae bacterium]|jgi:hypothetical protein